MKYKFSKYQILLIVLILISAGLVGYLVYSEYNSGGVVWRQVGTTITKAKEYKYFSQLTGLGVDSMAEVAPSVVGVMIDNHPDAYPQSGLEKAAIVYEAPAEGGITRFFGIFASTGTVAAKVGPVRSARPYFLDWLREYGDALYLHSGGSPEALILIKESDIFDANEFWWGSYYWRADDRSAPHNLYTSSENWQKIWDKFGGEHAKVGWEGWEFADKLTVTSTHPIKEINIKYAPDYEVSWRYDSSIGAYYRSMRGVEHRDDSNNILQAANVVVLQTSMSILDEIGRKKITTAGAGEARVLRGGVLMRGIWKKESASARTRFYDSGGVEIAFKPGVTWVQVVGKDAEIEVGN